MDYALSGAWGHTSRGFWTKRKKTATSLLAILALLAGIAVAFKLFERQVPNNVVRDATNFTFKVQVFGPPAGGGTPRWNDAGPPPDMPIFDDVEQFPGDTRTKRVRIINTNTSPPRDATFFMYVDPASIVVRDCTLGPDPADPTRFICTASAIVPQGDPRWTRFVNFWRLTVDMETILSVNDGSPANNELNENDHGLLAPLGDPSDHDDSTTLRSRTACEGGLREFPRSSPCNLGTIRAAGTRELGQSGLQPLDTRWYRFSMQEVDDGTDQSAFKGWSITWTFVFQAKVPADPNTALVTER